MRLLLLFSDRGWAASQPGAVRDLGALLPALAAACTQEARFGSHSQVSTAELPELENEVTNLVKVTPSDLILVNSPESSALSLADEMIFHHESGSFNLNPTIAWLWQFLLRFDQYSTQ